MLRKLLGGESMGVPVDLSGRNRIPARDVSGGYQVSDWAKREKIGDVHGYNKRHDGGIPRTAKEKK
jgi:hypothetical protein